MKMTRRTAMMALTGLWLCAVAAPLAQETPKTAPATHVTKAQIQEFIANLPRGRTLGMVETMRREGTRL